jgi:hypothetical protein
MILRKYCGNVGSGCIWLLWTRLTNFLNRCFTVSFSGRILLREGFYS